MFGKNSSSSGSSTNVELNLTLDLKNATFSGITTFDSAVINNSTLTQVGDASFENVTIDGSLTLSDVTGNLIADVTGNLTGNVTGNVTGNLTGNVIGNVTGDVTGTLIPATNGSINDTNTYSISYGVSGPNVSGFPSHFFYCNSNLMLSVNEYGMVSSKHFTCQDTIYGNLTGNVTGIFYPDNSGTSSITGVTGEGIEYSAKNSLFNAYHWFTVNNTSISLLSSSAIDNYVLMTTKGITNNTTPITNNATLAQVGASTFTDAITATGGIYTPIITGTNGLELSTTATTGTHNFKIYGDQKVQITNTSLTNYVDLTQTGDSTFMGAITANGVINANAGINIGSTANTDITKIIQNVVSSNMTELALYAGDEGTTSTISVPIAEESASTDFVTIRSTNAGVHHAFSTAGNYYYGKSIVPSYSSLPTLTTLQIGGSTSVSFACASYNTFNYHWKDVALPKGYYLVHAYLDLTPSISNAILDYGLSSDNASINEEYAMFHQFTSTSRACVQFTYYINNSSTSTWYFIFWSTGTIIVTSGKCTFIRMA